MEIAGLNSGSLARKLRISTLEFLEKVCFEAHVGPRKEPHEGPKIYMRKAAEAVPESHAYRIEGTPFPPTRAQK